MNELLQMEQIKKLEHRYYCHLDCKRFAAMLELFAEGAATAYDSGRNSYESKPPLVVCEAQAKE